MGEAWIRRLIYLFAALVLIATLRLGLTANAKLGDVSEAGPCRHSLARQLPDRLTVTEAIDTLLTNPSSDDAPLIRSAIRRAVQAPECVDQSFLICAEVRGLQFCEQSELAARIRRAQS